jgi:hypothetical protein
MSILISIYRTQRGRQEKPCQTAVTGRLGQHLRAGQIGQENQNITSRRGEIGKDRWNMSAGTGEPNRITGSGKPRYSRDKTEDRIVGT